MATNIHLGPEAAALRDAAMAELDEALNDLAHYAGAACVGCILPDGVASSAVLVGNGERCGGPVPMKRVEHVATIGGVTRYTDTGLRCPKFQGPDGHVTYEE